MPPRACSTTRRTTITATDAPDPDRWVGVGIAEMLAVQIDFLVEVFGQRRGLDRAVYLRTFKDADFRERSARLQTRVTDSMAALLESRSDEIRHADPALAVDFALRIVFSFLTDHFTVGDRDRIAKCFPIQSSLTNSLKLCCLCSALLAPGTAPDSFVHPSTIPKSNSNTPGGSA